MNVIDAMMARRSVRKFKADAVTDEQVELLLRCAMSGPSAHNCRPWEFYVVTRPDALAALRKASSYCNYESPMIIIVAGNKRRGLPLQLNDYWIQDCSAAIENLLLAACSMGLGTCWCGLLPQVRPVERVRKILDIPEHIVPLGLIHIGYPSEVPEPRTQYDAKRIHFVG